MAEEQKRFSVETDTRQTRRCGEARWCVYDDDFGYDALIRVHGDFETPEQQREYCQAVCDALNAAKIPTPETSSHG